jgi:hypothetical protein
MRGVTAGVTTVALVLQPQLLVAGESTAVLAPTKIVTGVQNVQTPKDIVLKDKGVLVGRIVNAQGRPVANSPVSLQAAGRKVVRVVSDNQGRFKATGLNGGVYHVASTGHQGAYRLWAPRTAPPTAAKGLSIVSQPVDVVRGQYGSGSTNPFSTAGQWIAEHPIITAGVVAAAIAIPIALDDDDDPPPATP